MACNQCTPCTNCTPPTPVSISCEECADIISSSCVYYKGSYGNNLGLPANFRFNNFAEKVLKRLSNLPDDLVDTSVDSIEFTPSSNFLDLTATITLTDEDSTEINGSLDVRRYYTVVEFAEGTKSIDSSSTILTLKTNAAVNHNVNHSTTGYINPLTSINNGGRVGRYRINGVINFLSDKTGDLTIDINQSNTTLKSYTVTIHENEYSSFNFKTVDLFELDDNVLPTKDYNIQLSFTNTDEETVGLTNFKGELEVSEIG
jgi:hypothetical protein